MAQSDDAAECIGLIRRLGGPVADLQVPSLAASCIWIPSIMHCRCQVPAASTIIAMSPRHHKQKGPCHLNNKAFCEWPVRLHTGMQHTLVAQSNGVDAMQDEFLRAMKASLGASLKAASAALEHSAEAGAVALEQRRAPSQQLLISCQTIE